MKTIGISMFRADAGRHLTRRAQHLLAKEGVDEWVWVVRPAADMTLQILRDESKNHRVVIADEGWPLIDDRMSRLSAAADFGVGIALARGAERILWHESDLFSPADVVALLGRTKAAVVGGWPVLPGDNTDRSLMLMDGAAVFPSEQFYDTWAYRHGDVRFENKALRPDEPFQIDSVGSVALIDAEYFKHGARFWPGAFVKLCEWVRATGGEIWCDPRVTVVQPLELWVFNND